MSEKDRERWDKKWGARSGEIYEPHLLLTKHRGLLVGGGDALDLACGRGQNAIWLARLGYRVTGVDISAVALESARVESERQDLAEQVRFERTDIDEYALPQDSYDLICVIRFLDRSLYTEIRSSIKMGGLIVYATRHTGAAAIQPEMNQAYLLERGELLEQFAGWTVLHYHEGAVEAEIIARKPTGI